MYQQYWGFLTPPFHVGQEGSGYFKSPSQVEALARLAFVVDDVKRLNILVGPTGIGKSALLDAFARRQRLQGHQVVRISLLGLQYDELVLVIAEQLGETPCAADTISTLWRRIEDRLIVNRYQQLPSIFLFDDVDEAEQQVLTALTRLAQWKHSDESRITIVLSCRDDRVHLLGERLIDRCELRVELGAWEAADTADFLHESCRLAGREERVFDHDAVERLHEIAAGIPRRIRQVAELALVAGAGSEQITRQTIDDVVAEFGVAGQLAVSSS